MAEWRDIPGLEGRYQCTKDGRVRLTREIKPVKQQKGYFTVEIFAIHKSGKSKLMLVHRLVALAWIPNPTNAPQVNHLDGIKWHNHSENLEWCTPAENMKHAWATGLIKVTDRMREGLKIGRLPRGRKQKPPLKGRPKVSLARRKLTPPQLDEARRRVALGEMQKDIAKEFGISKALLSMRLGPLPYKNEAA